MNLAAFKLKRAPRGQEGELGQADHEFQNGRQCSSSCQWRYRKARQCLAATCWQRLPMVTAAERQWPLFQLRPSGTQWPRARYTLTPIPIMITRRSESRLLNDLCLPAGHYRGAP